MSDPGNIGISAVRTVGLPISDQDRAVAFYVGSLGLEVRVDEPFGDGSRWIEVAPAGAVTTIALAPHQEGQPIGVDTGVRLTANDAEVAHAALLAAGVDVDPEVLRWPGMPPMFSFRDPDANVLYLVEPM